MASARRPRRGGCLESLQASGASGPTAQRRPAKVAASDEGAVSNYPQLLRRYRRLMEISRDLSSTLERPALLKRIIEAARELTATEIASILLIDPRSGELRFEASTHTDPRLQSRELAAPRAGSIADWVMTNGTPLVVPDVSKDPRHFVQVDRWTNRVRRSVLAVPMTTRDKVLGVLEVINKVGDSVFAAEDVDTLETLAAQAAVAIETARLFQQSDQVSEMVHELRTPLASLSATSYMLLRSDVPEQQRTDFIRTIQRETTRLTQLTGDFLDLSRLESGRVRLNLEPFSMPDLVAECLIIVEPQAREREIQCGVELTAEASDCPRVVGDRAKIKQVLLNLLTNAIKYNRHAGAVTVRAACRGRIFETFVSDTGEGIAPESLPRIFDKFYRVADAEGRPQGAGLGLAIAKKIVETHGGEISAESTPGVGTAIRFTLPLRQ